jgi:hypothetical protein
MTAPSLTMKVMAVQAEATGIPRGWSKLLGAATKDGLGRSRKHSLEERGDIARTKTEGSPNLISFDGLNVYLDVACRKLTLNACDSIVDDSAVRG